MSSIARKVRARSQPDISRLVEKACRAHQEGGFAKAERLYCEILERKPDDFDALHLFGVLRYQQGQAVEALRLVSSALKVNPGSADALSNHGVILETLRRHEEALESLDRALMIIPTHVNALNNRGNALKSLKRFDEALVAYDAALRHSPNHREAVNNRGVVLLELKRFEEALKCFDAALAGQPSSAEILANRGNALTRLGRLDEALASFERALAIEPNYVDAHYNHGTALLDLQRDEEALQSFDAALAIRPDHVEALGNRGNALLKLNRLDEAIASYDAALALAPDYVEILHNRAHCLRNYGRPLAALESIEKALEIKPDYVEAQFDIGLTRLTLGDFAAGWRSYEARWETEEFAPQRRNFSEPLWLGEEPVEHKSVLLHAEQGFGDTIQFARYAPLLAKRGASVILEVQPQLKSLLSGMTGVSMVAARGEPLPHFDLHCPLLSLPLAFKTELDSIPAEVPYIHAPQARTAHWHGRLAPRTPRVGIAWAGRVTHKNDHNRSIALARLTPLFDAPAQFVSLQREVRAEDDAVLRRHPGVVRVGEELEDFADTAGLISALDLVISVDTAVAHLAGAMAKPVWILLPYAAEFRWLQQRDDSPWYPTARLFRQPVFDDWETVIAFVRDRLARV